jgi:sugar lactone lactonase YvrE
VMVSDGGALRQVTQAGVVTTVNKGYDPYDWEGIAIDVAGTVYGSGTTYAPPPDSYGASVYTRTLAGALNIVVSNWTTSATETRLGYGGLAVDSSGNMYLTDAANHRIVKFTAAGAVSVFAGNGKAGLTDGAGIVASFNKPSDLSIDSAGNLYVSDTGNSAIRKITPAGVVTTFGKLTTPGAITADTAGNVFVIAGSPRGLYRISSDMASTVSYPLAGITDPITGLTVDSQGRVYAGTFGVGAQIFKIAF